MPTKIEWCDEVWNPVTGCTPVSEGCQHCYAERMAQRLQGRFGYPAGDPFRVIWHHDKVLQPSRWTKPRLIFVCSMGDLFHDHVPDEYIWTVFQAALCGNQRHTYLFLTKRPTRMKQWFETYREKFLGDRPNPCIWLGVTAENQVRANERVPILLSIPAAVHFISAEPLLGPLNIGDYLSQASKLSLCIAGPETGPGARPCKPEWIESLRRQCQQAGVPFVDKRWPRKRIMGIMRRLK